MKKVFTIILFAAGMISFVSAQSKDQDFAYNNKKTGNDFDKHTGFGTGTYNDGFSMKEKSAMLQKINREFDQKIAAVKSNRHISGWLKAKKIESLQAQRKNEISKVEYQFSKTNHKNKKW